MRARTVTLSLVAAAALVLTPMAGAVAEPSSHAGTGVTKSAEAKAKATARKLERAAKARGAVVLGGTVTAVDPATSSLTFTVHGGRYKVLRGTPLSVTVAPTAKITRDGVVTLAEVLVGDHVTVKSWRYDFVVTSVPAAVGTEGTVTVTVTATAHRVAASPADTEDDSADDAAGVPAA